LGSAAGGASGSGAVVARLGVASAAIDETKSSAAVAARRVILGERAPHFTGYTTIAIECSPLSESQSH
jgi:hypothetical protein